MATIETGGSPINLQRRAEFTASIWVKASDDAFGPHFGIQRDTMMIYISPTDDEIIELFKWCAVVLVNGLSKERRLQVVEDVSKQLSEGKL